MITPDLVGEKGRLGVSEEMGKSERESEEVDRVKFSCRLPSFLISTPKWRCSELQSSQERLSGCAQAQSIKYAGMGMADHPYPSAVAVALIRAPHSGHRSEVRRYSR